MRNRHGYNQIEGRKKYAKQKPDKEYLYQKNYFAK